MSECWLPKLLYQNWPEEKLLQTSAQRWSRVLHDDDDDVFFTFLFVACFLDTCCVLSNITTTCHTNNYNYNNHITRAKMKHLLFCAKQRLRRIAAGLSLQRTRFNPRPVHGWQSGAGEIFPPSISAPTWQYHSPNFSPHLTVSLPQFPYSLIPPITDATQS